MVNLAHDRVSVVFSARTVGACFRPLVFLRGSDTWAAPAAVFLGLSSRSRFGLLPFERLLFPHLLLHSERSWLRMKGQGTAAWSGDPCPALPISHRSYRGPSPVIYVLYSTVPSSDVPTLPERRCATFAAGMTGPKRSPVPLPDIFRRVNSCRCGLQPREIPDSGNRSSLASRTP